ncbi:type VI secretion system membrane subunit TssM [soil metagenome]
MMRMAIRVFRVGAGPAGLLGIFLLLAIYGARWMGLTGTQLWLFRIGLVLLGLLASGLLAFFLRGRERSRGTTSDNAVDSAMDSVRRQLRKIGSRAGLASRPVVLVAGPPDSAKTTAIVRSDLAPELLAGEVWRGDEIIATPAVNAWIASETVWVEAGGSLLTDAKGWAGLVKHLRPARLRAALSRRPQAPRAVVVCISCNEFLRPAAAESLAASAQLLRERLNEMSTDLGVRLPVYVVFTKADRLPHFLDFVRSLSDEEAREILGATIPVAPPSDAGTHADQEGRRLHLAFERIIQALALRRTGFLAREGSDEVRAGAYEFPREIRKIAPLATRFLLDLSRPGQRGASPFLRGFYFAGVRPVVVKDEGPSPSPRTGSRSGPVGATAVFDARELQAAARSAASSRDVRRVPQWTFLPGIFSHLVTQDRVAMEVTGGGARVHILRRIGLAAATLMLVLFSAGLVRSFLGNQDLLDDAGEALRVAEGVGGGGERYMPLEELQRLDRVRAEAARIRGWEMDGRPLRLRFGLYVGDRILPDLRFAYFQRFDRGMWSATRSDLVATLAGLPGPDEDASLDYGSAYDALKAYLVTTRFPQHSTPDFLAPVLLAYWQGPSEMELERAGLAGRQFEFFGSELAIAPPYDEMADETRIARARTYLGRFADADQFYQTLLSSATAESGAPVDFNRTYPGSEIAVSNAFTVPAAFTRDGWNHVQATLLDLDALLAREDWVLGGGVVAPADRQRLAAELGERYVEEYVTTWTRFLETGRVLGFQGVPDAAAKLARLSDNQSPLLQLLALAAFHTAVDTSQVSRAFQPVHVVMPPGITDRFISEANQSYVQGLVGLHSAMERASAEQGAARTAALDEASGAADQSRLQVRQIAQAFNVDASAGPVGDAVQRLMLAPLDDAERLARAAPSAEAGAQASSFCSQFSPVMAKYPFNTRGTTEATMDEVAAMFQPNASLLSSFEMEALQGIVVAQGSGYAAAPGATVRPSAEFLRFFTRAKQVSRAFFSPDGSGPQVAFTLRPQPTEQLPEILVTIDGQRQEVSRTAPASRTFLWDGNRAGDARVEATVAGNRVTLLATSGPWALFRLFHQAQWQEIRPNLYQVTWTLQQPTTTLTAEVSFERGAAAFDPAFLGGLGCVSRISQ